MAEYNNKICTICKTEMVGEYCYHCGQRDTGKRLKIVTLVKEMVFNLFDLEKSGLATILLLIKTPSKVINNYWDGYRKYYEPPGKLIIYALLIIGIHIIIHDNLIFGLTLDFESIAPQGAFLLIFLSLLTLSSYLTYLKQKQTILEHAIANIYLFCTWVIIMIILYDVINYFIIEDINVGYASALSLIALVMIWTGRTFCRNKTWIRIVLSTILQFLVFIALVALLAWLLDFFNILRFSPDGN